MKKTKLTISGNVKRPKENIGVVRSQNKKEIVVEKKINRSRKTFFGKSQKQDRNFEKFKKPVFQKPSPLSENNFEKRKIAEQRATRRLKGDFESPKENKGKIISKKREFKLTLSRALSDDIETKSRSIASLRRAKLKTNRDLEKKQKTDFFKPVKRDVNIPEVITIRELANRMAEQSSNIIKHLLGMGVTATINHTIDSDTAEYLVKEFGHTPIKEKKAEEIVKKIKELKSEN